MKGAPPESKISILQKILPEEQRKLTKLLYFFSRIGIERTKVIVENYKHAYSNS